MFWSLILKPGKNHSMTVEKSFHLSSAAIDPKTVKDDKEQTSLFIKVEGQENVILCTLSKLQHPQVPFDIVFSQGTALNFSVVGPSAINLIGYLMMEDDEDMMDSDDESIETMLDQKKKSGATDQSLSGQFKDKDLSSGMKRKLNEVVAKANGYQKKKKTYSNGDSADSSFNATADDDDSDDSYFDDLMATDSYGRMGDDEDDDDNDEEEEGDDDDDEDLKIAKNFMNIKTPQSGKNPKLDASVNKTPQQQAKSVKMNGIESGKKDKQSIAQQGNQKTPQQQQKTQNTPIITQQSPKQQKQQANQNTPKQQPGDQQQNKKSPKDAGSISKKPDQQKAMGKTQKLEGGVMVEDLKEGEGAVAKPGRMISVYYTGRLKNNNKVFDQTVQGPGFKFRLGKGEVIKAWDVAFSGMKVGSKRRITCPPAMAYGQKGSPPAIPPNSTLVFDVELKAVN